MLAGLRRPESLSDTHSAARTPSVRSRAAPGEGGARQLRGRPGSVAQSIRSTHWALHEAGSKGAAQ